MMVRMNSIDCLNWKTKSYCIYSILYCKLHFYFHEYITYNFYSFDILLFIGTSFYKSKKESKIFTSLLLLKLCALVFGYNNYLLDTTALYKKKIFSKYLICVRKENEINQLHRLSFDLDLKTKFKCTILLYIYYLNYH